MCGNVFVESLADSIIFNSVLTRIAKRSIGLLEMKLFPILKFRLTFQEIKHYLNKLNSVSSFRVTFIL